MANARSIRSEVEFPPLLNLQEDRPHISADFVIVNDTTLAQVKSVSENDLRLDSHYGEVTSIKKLFGFYFATEL